MTALRLDPSLTRIHPDAFVAANATVLGDVWIGAGSSVWFGAVIRGDEESIRIGADTNVQDGAVLHADPGFPCRVGSRVSVGHGAVVHGATLEDGVVVGLNASVLNGARVGAGSIVAAGAVVPEGSVIAPGSLVAGVPARPRRTLSAEEIDALGRVAAYYADNGRAYRVAGFAAPVESGGRRAA